jgi:hypothetical protein
MKEHWKEALGTITIAIVLGVAQLWRNAENFHPPVQPQPSSIQHEADLAMWQGILNSNNPSDFQEYLTKYPNGQFAGIAKNRLQQFSQQPTPIAIPQPTPIAITQPTQIPIVNEPPLALSSYQQPLDHSEKSHTSTVDSSNTVVDFVRNYYRLIKQVPYEENWAMLSDNFKLKVDFDSYKKWWDTVDTMQLTEIEQIDPNTVKIVLQYSMQNGRKVCSMITSQVVEYQNGWVIDKQSREKCKYKRGEKYATYSSQNWMKSFNKYPELIQISAPNGFVIKNSPSLSASTIKEKRGYYNLGIVGHIDVDGQKFYMTEWSWSQYNKGKNPSWVLLH